MHTKGSFLMLKRIFGLVLCIVMLASVVPFGTFASYHEHISVSGSSQTIDGVTYKVVTTESALKSAVSAGGNIILGNDIALSDGAQLSIAPGTLLDGNGYVITFSNTKYRMTDSLIVFQTGKSTSSYGGVGTVTIRNLQFGADKARMVIPATSGLAKETSKTVGSKIDKNGATVPVVSTSQIHVVWQNVEFYVSNTSITATNGGILSTAYGTHEFSGCTLTANLTSSTSLVGGWVGTMSGAQIYMKDCITKGSVQGTGGVGGFIGEANGQSASFENCVNMATITAKSTYCGGFVGNIGTGIHSIYFVNCKNYGIVRSQGLDYNSMAGGIVGRMSNTKTYDAGVNGFYGCINYGKISDGNSAGGILGRNHDGDSANPQYFQFKDCLNMGEVVGDAHAGGMAGALTPTLTSATMINCANVGKITSASGKAGNFAGVLSGATLTNCYAAGYITAATAGVLAGQISGTYTAQDGSTKTYVAPKLTNVRYLSNLASSAAQGATLASGADLTDMLADMDAAYGLHFATTKSPADFGSYVMAFVPVMRGWQQSTNSTTGKTDVRFAAVVNTLVDHASVGFKAVVRSNGKSVKVEQDVTEVYTELSATSENGALAKITAASLTAKYIYAFVLTGVPLASDAAIEVTPYAVDAQGVKHYGKTTVLVCSNGQYHEESMLLNGVPLEQFSVVYPSASSNNEKLIAERLAAKIG